MTPTGTITNPTTDPLTCGSTRGVGRLPDDLK